jgi:hypothetical protein
MDPFTIPDEYERQEWALEMTDDGEAGHTPDEQVVRLPAARPAPSSCDLGIRWFRDIAAEVDAAGTPVYLFRGVWPADAYGVLAAPDKSGKSWAAIDAAVSVASGTPWLGHFPVDAPGQVRRK